MIRLSNVKCLFFMPSFYGGGMWLIWWLLYELRFVPWYCTEATATLIFASMQIAFFASILLLFPRYWRWYQTREPSLPSTVSLREKLALIGLYCVGFAGLGLYVRDITSGLSTVAGFQEALIKQSALIRVQLGMSASIGTQLTYFGWIAVMLTVYLVGAGKLGRGWLWPALGIFLGNCLYIDRTRPTWILFITLLMILPAARSIRLAKIVTTSLLVIALIIGLFVGIGQWIGKTSNRSALSQTVLPEAALGPYYYGTSAFAYFNELISKRDSPQYDADGTLYPLMQTLAAAGLAKPPTNQVLKYLDVPFAANTGTLLQPFYQDAGLFGVFVGIFVCSFGLDLMGLMLLRCGRPLALAGWANLCFVSFVGFFTPKLNNTPTWIIGAFALGSLYLWWVRRSPVHPVSQPA